MLANFYSNWNKVKQTSNNQYGRRLQKAMKKYLKKVK